MCPLSKSSSTAPISPLLSHPSGCYFCYRWERNKTETDPLRIMPTNRWMTVRFLGNIQINDTVVKDISLTNERFIWIFMNVNLVV